MKLKNTTRWWDFLSTDPKFGTTFVEIFDHKKFTLRSSNKVFSYLGQFLRVTFWIENLKFHNFKSSKVEQLGTQAFRNFQRSRFPDVKIPHLDVKTTLGRVRMHEA